MNNSINSATFILKILQTLNIKNFAIAPGSRNAPFSQALDILRINADVLFDERSLGFFGLGTTKSTFNSSCIITTSGTAVGNLFPAVMEAHTTHVPLIIITADRPYELHEVGSNQTCNQHNIFGAYAEFLNIPGFNSQDTECKNIICNRILQHYIKAQHYQVPLHINVELAAPLYGNYDANIVAYKHSDYSFKNIALSSIPNKHLQFNNIVELIKNNPAFKSVFIVGAMNSNETEMLYRFAVANYIPIIADVQSNLRKYPGVISAYELDIVGKTGIIKYLKDCESFFIFEGRFISNNLLEIINESTAKKYFFSKYFENLNATNSQGVYSIINYFDTFAADCPELSTDNEQIIHRYTNSICELLKACNHRNKTEFPKNSEIEMFNEINHAIEKQLFLGNSLVARYADTVLVSSHNIFSNRGLSGIDGLIATACGISKNQPTIAVLGDTSTIYDLSSIALLKQNPVKLIIFNNNGGKIFDKFPICKQQVKEKFFTNKVDINFELICKAFNIHYFNPKSKEDFASLLKTPLSKITQNVQMGCVIELKFNEDAGLKAYTQFLTSK